MVDETLAFEEELTEEEKVQVQEIKKKVVEHIKAQAGSFAGQLREHLASIRTEAEREKAAIAQAVKKRRLEEGAEQKKPEEDKKDKEKEQEKPKEKEAATDANNTNSSATSSGSATPEVSAPDAKAYLDKLRGEKAAQKEGPTASS